MRARVTREHTTEALKPAVMDDSSYLTVLRENSTEIRVAKLFLVNKPRFAAASILCLLRPFCFSILLRIERIVN